MDNQSSIGISSLCFAFRGNLGYDFINVRGGVKGHVFQEQLDHMEPSHASNPGQHEFQRLHRVTLSIGRDFSGSKPYPFIVNAERKPRLVERGNVIPRALLLCWKHLQSRLQVSDSIELLLLCQDMPDPTNMTDPEPQ
jgi:hypothetical protein